MKTSVKILSVGREIKRMIKYDSSFSEMERSRVQQCPNIGTYIVIVQINLPAVTS